jgi:hypothetical protein
MPNEPIRPSGSGSSPNVPRLTEFSIAIALYLQHRLQKEVATYFHVLLPCTLMTSERSEFLPKLRTLPAQIAGFPFIQLALHGWITT